MGAVDIMSGWNAGELVHVVSDWIASTPKAARVCDETLNAGRWLSSASNG